MVCQQPPRAPYLDGILEGEDAPLALRLIPHVRVLLAHAHHDPDVPRPPDDGGKDGPGGVVAGEPGLAHAGAVVDDQGGNLLVAHVDAGGEGLAVVVEDEEEEEEAGCKSRTDRILKSARFYLFSLSAPPRGSAVRGAFLICSRDVSCGYVIQSWAAVAVLNFSIIEQNYIHGVCSIVGEFDLGGALGGTFF